MVRFFDPADLIIPLGPYDRHVGEDGQGAVIWVQGVHAEGVAIGFQGMRQVAEPTRSPRPDSEEFDLPRMSVEDNSETYTIPALRGGVSSSGGKVFKFKGTYYLRVMDPTRPLRCSVDFLEHTLRLEFVVDQLA